MKSEVYVKVKGSDGAYSEKDIASLDNIEFNSLVEQKMSSGENGWHYVRILSQLVAGLPDSIPYQEPAPKKQEKVKKQA